MAGSSIHDLDTRRFFGADGVARRCIEQVLEAGETVRIATAYFEASGYQVLQDILSGKRIYLLVGRNEFVPSTMDHSRLRHARRWQSRLQERGEQHRSFAQIPVFVRQEAGGKVEEGFEMERLARELYVREDESIELEGVLNFIHNADALTTSTFYKDLVNILNQAEIERLPAGIRSARIWKGKKRLFVLFRSSSRQVSAGLFDFSGRLIKNGDRREVVMQVIRCEVDEPKAPARLYPEDDVFDAWIERSRQTWADLHGISPHRLKIICAMALIPEET